MGKNGYLEKQKKQIDAYRQAEKDTYVQYMVDMFSLALSDPDVMGKDVFGKDRLSKVIHAVEKNYDTITRPWRSMLKLTTTRSRLTRSSEPAWARRTSSRLKSGTTG